ncbi:N-acetylmuramoyl-L-alanine amidase [Streptomyces murinus]|uniref:N-acetylmuramoyl-L-alanine amidase n=1 Tax=Streptomyces murinus TaxID=33900 RepID=UPI00380D534D
MTENNPASPVPDNSPERGDKAHEQLSTFVITAAGGPHSRSWQRRVKDCDDFRRWRTASKGRTVMDPAAPSSMAIDRRLFLRGIAQGVAACAVSTTVADYAGATTTMHPRSSARGKANVSPRPPMASGRVPQPAIVPRTSWESHPAPHPPWAHAATVKAAFIHHTDSCNDYRAHEVLDIIRSIHHDHTENRGWDDIGYNFLVDRFGSIYEGRAGSIEAPVIGAHSVGFNVETIGIAAIGSFDSASAVPSALMDAIAHLAAWKLSLYGISAQGQSVLTSSNSESRYAKGTQATFHAISGHRDAFYTNCPGLTLYNLLAHIRDRAAEFQRGFASAPAHR